MNFLKKHYFQLSGVLFISAVVMGSFMMEKFMKMKFEAQDLKKKSALNEADFGIVKRKSKSIQEEYYVI